MTRCASCHRPLPHTDAEQRACSPRPLRGDLMTVHRDGRYETTAARALWFCVDCGAVVPVDAREIHDRTHDDQPRPTLAELQARYLEVRGHTLSIDVWTPIRDALADQAEYVLDEARELLAAVQDDGCGQVTAVTGRLLTADELRTAVRHEIADVVLAATTLANILGVTVEACIAEKTEADRGR